jgi:ABC-type transporter Mla subunit MlaD
MKEGKVARIAVPQVITVLCLMAMGVNALIQLGLQRDMAAKSQQLHATVAKAAALTGQTNNGLTGLKPLSQATQQMNDSLTQIQSLSAQMNQGLAALNTTVASIGSTVKNIDGSVGESTQELTTLHKVSSDLSGIMGNLKQTNGDVIGNLNGMIADEQAINQDLEQMDAKTKMVP